MNLLLSGLFTLSCLVVVYGRQSKSDEISLNGPKQKAAIRSEPVLVSGEKREPRLSLDTLEAAHHRLQANSGSQEDIAEEGAGLISSCPKPNIRQYVYPHLNSYSKNSMILSTVFVKRGAESSLKVTWSGDMRLTAQTKSGNSCRRYFFTFNGEECHDPAPIDALLYSNDPKIVIHRHTTVTGLCGPSAGKLAEGPVTIGFHIGACPSQPHGSFTEGHPLTGWDSVTRLLVEEIEGATLVQPKSYHHDIAKISVRLNKQ